MTPTAKRRLSSLLKAVVVIGLLYLLARKGLISISVEDSRKALTHYENILPSLGAIVIATVLGTLRWHLLLKAHGIHLKFMRTFQLNFVGLFFNIALPGAVSGDFVKAFYIGKELDGQRARAFGSILFDRVAGLAALSIVSASALGLGISQFWGTPMFMAIQFFVTFAALGSIAFFGYLFLVREHHDPLLMLFRALEKKFAKAGALTRIYEGLRHYHNHRITVLQVIAISLIIHLLIGYTLWNFSHALGEADLAFLPICVVFPLGLLVTAIPVMPAGVGTGHAAFFYLFKLIGSQRGADVFTLYALVQLLSGAIGGLVYLRFKAHAPSLETVEATS